MQCLLINIGPEERPGLYLVYHPTTTAILAFIHNSKKCRFLNLSKNNVKIIYLLFALPHRPRPP